MAKRRSSKKTTTKTKKISPAYRFTSLKLLFLLVPVVLIIVFSYKFIKQQDPNIQPTSYIAQKTDTQSPSPVTIDNVLTNPSKYMPLQEKKFQVSTVPPNTELTKNWKEFTSDYYGYSLKYPNNWVFSSSIYEDPYYHTKEELTRLYSTKPIQNTNTYFCLEIRKGPRGATQMSEMAHYPFTADVFTTPSGDQLAIFTDGVKNGSMTQSRIKLVQNTPNVITYSIKTKRNKEFIEFSGVFDCVGGDKPAPEDINDDFNTRPEVVTAKEILKSLNFQH